MLLYVGTYCDSGTWIAPKWGCRQPTSSPKLGMYVSLSLVTSFFIEVVYMSLIHYFIWNWHICYFICRPLVGHRCVKSTKSSTLLWQANRYIYVSLYLYVCVLLSLIWCLKRPKSVTHLSPPQGTCIFVEIGIYIFLCSLIVSKWCLKSTQSGSLLVRHHDPPLLTHVQ